MKLIACLMTGLLALAASADTALYQVADSNIVSFEPASYGIAATGITTPTGIRPVVWTNFDLAITQPTNCITTNRHTIVLTNTYVGYTNVVTNGLGTVFTNIGITTIPTIGVVTNYGLRAPTNLAETVFVKQHIYQQILTQAGMLRTLEGMYVTFLTNEWTTALRTATLIGPTNVITAYNTDTAQNMTYLVTLRAMDVAPNKPTYGYLKNEFESFRINIERLGGSLSTIGQ